jgi:hypothetical protein
MHVYKGGMHLEDFGSRASVQPVVRIPALRGLFLKATTGRQARHLTQLGRSGLDEQKGAVQLNWLTEIANFRTYEQQR